MGWTQEDITNFYSPVKARVPKGHALEGQMLPYGWDYFAYGSRRAIDADTEAIGYADNFRWVASLASRNFLTPNSNLLIVGCGIGATIHAIQQYPLASSANVWGTDTSVYLHQIKTINAPAGFDTNCVLQIDITDLDALDQFKAITGIKGQGKFDALVCETVTETIPVAELPKWFLACDLLVPSNGIIAHIVYSKKNDEQKPPEWDIGWNWLTVGEWGLLAPTHYFIDASNPTIAYIPGGA